MPVYDIDGSGTCTANLDGLLLWKYFLGLRGAGLLNGSTPPASSPRNTASEIESYIQHIWWQLDVGGDGEVGLGDVNMIRLYMAGLRGANLTGDSGATGGSHITAGSIRDKAPAIEAFIAKMVA